MPTTSSILIDAASRMVPHFDPWGILLAPWKEEKAQMTQSGYAVKWPDPIGLIAAWQRGFIPWDIAADGCKFQGVDIGLQKNLYKFDQIVKKAWAGVGNMLLHRPSIEAVISGRQRELVDPEDFKILARQAGADVAAWDRMEETLREYPAPGELAVATNRGIIDVDQYKRMLKWKGGYDKPSIDIYEELRHQIPSMQELVHLEAKEAFTVDIANALKLYDEFPGNMAKYANWQGFGRPLEFNVNSDGANIPATWALLFWAAHWTPISPTQVYDMFTRLREGRLGKWDGDGVKPQVFTRDDADKWLRYQNYPKAIRENLLALSKRPIGLRFLKPIYMKKVISRDDALEELKDISFHDVDANRILIQWDIERDEQDAKELEKEEAEDKRKIKACLRKFVNRVMSMHSTGLLAFGDAVDQMVNAGWPIEAARACLESSAMARQESIAKAGIARVRKEFLSGAIGVDEAMAGLTGFGIVQEAATEYVNSWQIEFTVPRKMFSTGQVLKYYRLHGLTYNDAITRLGNLGWADPDRIIMLADADRLALQDQAKYLSALQRSGNQQAKQLEQLAKQAAQHQKLAANRLKYLTPVSTIGKWLKDGVVSESWVISRLQAMGFDSETISNYLKQWGFDVSVEEVNATEKQAKQVPLADLAKMVSLGEISVQEYASQLQSRGLSPLQIQEEIALNAPKGLA